MSGLFRRAALAGALALATLPAAAQDLQAYLHRYFAGAAIRFGYGGGTSSNNPRVELVIHYCASGAYYSSGRSCRPNIVAKGYQCTPVQDAGRWQVAAQGGRAALRWVSNGGAPGAIAVLVGRDGIVTDPRGNRFNRVGPARCR